MSEQFLHGVEVIELDDGARPIQTVKSSVIGLVGTAPQGPVNTPTLILGSRSEAVQIFGENNDANKDFTMIKDGENGFRCTLLDRHIARS